MITGTEYLKRAHEYLEAEAGRVEVFRYLSDLLKRGVRERREEDFLSAILEIKSFISGKHMLFVNFDLPNIHRLRAQKESIRREALDFLKGHLELICEACLLTRGAYNRGRVLYLLARYLPEIKDLEGYRYMGLVIVLLATLVELGKFSGPEEDQKWLFDLTLQALCRYDLAWGTRYFNTDKEVQEKLLHLKEKISFFPAFQKAIYRQIEMALGSENFPARDLLPGVLTREIWALLNARLDGKPLSVLKGKFQEVIMAFQVEVEGYPLAGETLNCVKRGTEALIKEHLSEKFPVGDKFQRGRSSFESFSDSKI